MLEEVLIPIVHFLWNKRDYLRWRFAVQKASAITVGKKDIMPMFAKGRTQQELLPHQQTHMPNPGGLVTPKEIIAKLMKSPVP
jgi:hypothetical protein